MLLTFVVVLVVTSGHCKQLVAPHLWFSNCISSVESILFFNTVLPMDGFFLMAMMIFVSPIIVCKSVSESFIIFLKVSISLKKNSGKVSVSLSSRVLALLVNSLAFRSIPSNSSLLYPLRMKSSFIFCISTVSVSSFEFRSIVLIICESGTDLKTFLGWKLCGRKYRLESVG